MVDDIISTGKTMMVAAQLIKEAGLKKPVCIGIHALFVSDAYSQLLQSDVDRVVTCNTIQHQSNAIDVINLIIEALS
jgi:ribose-phosphate pyrophosphokinase